MEKITNIAKNTSYFTFALILQKVISFSYFIILARNLAPEDLGKYYLAISFTTIFAIFIDIGLTNVLTREIARYNSEENAEEKIKHLVGGAMGMKIVLALFSSLACVSLVNILGYPELTKTLVYISIISMNLDSFTAGFFAIIRGFHNLIFESIASVLFQLIVLVFGLTALCLGLDLRWLIAALVAASFFNFIYSYFLSSKILGFMILPKWNSIIVKQLVILTAPFALYAIFQKAYMYLDAILLSKMAGDYFVGIYQVPFKIVFALQFLPMAFTASLYPAMSSYWINNKKQLAVSFERAMNYLIIISVPIAVGISILSDKIVLLLKEGYSDAILPMQIIMIALIFIFINFPIGSLLNACEKQKINTINMGAVLLFSIALNLILIPKFQAIGATITVLATNALMFALGIYWVPKIIDFKLKKICLIFAKVLLSAALMMILILFMKNFLNIFIIIIIGAVVYFFILFCLKGFKKEDLLSIYQSLLKKTNG